MVINAFRFRMQTVWIQTITIDVAAGELMTVEVRSRNKDYRGIAILEELDVVEMG
jgi:hypothetical protein